jgi:hypothetical protein
MSLDLNAFQTHLNCSFDINDVLRLGADNFEAEQMGIESLLERSEFEPSQLTSPDQFVALMIVVGLALRHDELLVDALRIARSRQLEFLVLERFAMRDSDSEPIDPRASGEPLSTAEELMQVLDSFQTPNCTLSPFVAACRHGRLDLLQEWMPFVLVNEYTRSFLQSGLLVACESDQVDCLIELLPHVDLQLWPLVCTAIERKAMRVVEHLLPRLVASDETPTDLIRTLFAVVCNGDVALADRVFDIFARRNVDFESNVPSVVRAAVGQGNADMLRFLLTRFNVHPKDIGTAFGDVKRNDDVFQILLERLEAWSGDAKEFDEGASAALMATSSLADAADKLKLVLQIQLRAPGACHAGVFPWFEVYRRGDAASAAVLLDDPRVAVTWMWQPFRFQRQHCRTLVTVLEHPRFTPQHEPWLVRMMDEAPGLPQYRACVPRMWLTDICMALRPLRLPSLVVDEIVRHLPSMAAMPSEERLTQVIVKINERRQPTSTEQMKCKR